VKIIGRDPPARDGASQILGNSSTHTYVILRMENILDLAPPITAEELGEGLNMKKDDARLAVLGEYDGWAKDHPNDAKMMGGFVFFSYLQKEKPDLLDFRGGVGSKWQIVHLWLRHGGRLKD
jgi:hypothetical protein